MDIENLNAFREQDPMEEVTLIDTEKANQKFEKIKEVKAIKENNKVLNPISSIKQELSSTEEARTEEKYIQKKV